MIRNYHRKISENHREWVLGIVKKIDAKEITLNQAAQKYDIAKSTLRSDQNFNKNQWNKSEFSNLLNNVWKRIKSENIM